MSLNHLYVKRSDKNLRCTILILCGLALTPTYSFGDEAPPKPPPTKPTTYESWDLQSVLGRVKESPTNIWGRLKLAKEWVWDEYPDQVLIHEENRIKWPRYLSAALNTPDWLDIGMTNRFRWEGYDYAFVADQEGTTWGWAQRTRFRKEIGRVLKLSESRVCQLHAKLIARLRGFMKHRQADIA